MIRLNLLPPKEKKELKWADLNQLVIILSVWLLFFLLLSSLFLIGSYSYLSNLLKKQGVLIEIRQDDPKIQHLLELENKVQQANRKIERIYLKQKELILWVPLLEEISELIPGKLYLKTFIYQPNTNQISLSGQANTRDDLIRFENSLKQSPYFTEIKSPLSNLLKQTNIDFSFTLKPVGID